MPEMQTAPRVWQDQERRLRVQPALAGADQCHEVNIMNGMNITPFLFEGESLVRVIIRDEAPWFVAADVCRVLGLAQPASAVRGLDEDEKGVHVTHTLGGDQEVLIVSESGLYALIFRSRKPAAIRFRKWVTQEVLPALRRTGGYRLSDDEMKAKLADRRVKMNERNATTRAVMAANQALQLIGRAGGPRAIAKNAPAFYGKLGIPVDMSSAFDQGEFDLGQQDEPQNDPDPSDKDEQGEE